LLSVAREFAPQVEAETETFREPLVPAATAVKQPKGQLLDLTGTEVEPNISPRSEASPSNEEGTNAGEAKGAPDRRLPTSVDPSPTEHSSLKDCSAQAQAGKYQKASDCYGRIARGGGFSAELANLEQVRVLSRALVEPDKALRALDDYAKRFPNGALRGEAALTRLDLLASSGQEERLIVEVDKILKSNWAPERHAELLLLKAEAFARADKCDLALSAADESERAGGPSQGIARVQQQCVQ
jgi:hypothetical protein